MKHIRRGFIAALATVFFSIALFSPCGADVVSVKTPKQLGGPDSFAYVEGGQVVIVGQGPVPQKIALNDVLSMKLEGARKLELKNGDIFNVTDVTLEENTVRFVSEFLGESQVPAAAVLKISPPPGKEIPISPPVLKKPPAPPKKKWSGKVQLGFTSTSGKVDTQNATFAAEAVRKGEETRLTLKAAARYGSTDGEETVNAQEGSGKIDLFLSERAYVYTNLGLLRDKINLIDLRVSGGVGAGWKLIRKDRVSLDGEAGLTAIWENYTSEADVDDETDLYARLAALFKWKLAKTAEFSEELELFPGFSSEAGYRLRSNSLLSTGVTEKISLALGFTVDYDSEPPAGVPSTSTVATAGVIYNF